MINQNEKTYKLCKGETHRKDSCRFVEALLKLAYAEPNAQIDNCEQEEKVKVSWISDRTLIITGKNSVRTEKLQNGTTIKALLELVKKYDNDFNYSKLRNSIQLLKSVDCDENEARNSTNTTQRVLEEVVASIKFQGIRQFKLILKGSKETLEDNLRYLITKIKDKYGNFEYSIEDRNKSSDQDNDKVIEKLSHLDCREQMNKFEYNIYKRDNNYKKGVFLIQANQEIQSWFLWRLIKPLNALENAEKFIIKIDVFVKISFENFLQKMASDMKMEVKGNVDRKIVIEKLIEYHETKSIVIIIKRFEELPDNQFDELCTFWSELFNSISNISRTSLEREKLWFVLFLVSNKEKCINKNIQNTEYPIELNFQEISKEELTIWLDKNKSDFQKSNYDCDQGYQIAYTNPFPEPYNLLDDICKYLFKLETGIEHFKHNWRHL